jgi:hypothetical protein
VRVEDETVWLTQKLMGVLFEVSVPTINEHLANLYAQGEIAKDATIRNFRTVQKERNRDVARNVDFYNLDAIIAGRKIFRPKTLPPRKKRSPRPDNLQSPRKISNFSPWYTFCYCADRQ